MNEVTPDVLSSTDPTPAKSGAGPAWLALLLALLSAVGLAWVMWQNYFESDDKTAAQQTRLEQQAQDVAALQNRITALQSQLTELSSADTGARLQAAERTLGQLKSESGQLNEFKQETSAWTRSMQAAIEGDQARIAVAEARLAAVSARSMNATAELDLAEIDYVLRLAQERLSLFGDTRTASQALQIAGQQLAVFDNPLYAGLQQDIALARQKLLSVSQPDYAQIFSTLGAMQGSISDLPFKGDYSPGQTLAGGATDAAQAGWWERLKGAFSGLVTVKRSEKLESSPPVLADQAMLRQQAWMELELARLAAMRRDQSSWTSSLGRFSSALSQWFDPASPAVTAMAKSLSELQAQDVDPALPDISAPWTALQAIRSAGLGSPPAASPTVPVAAQPAAAVNASTATAGLPDAEQQESEGGSQPETAPAQTGESGDSQE